MNISAIIIGLIVYLPMEDFLLKFLPVSDEILVYLRLASELVVYFIFLLAFLGRLIYGKVLPKTPIGLWVVAFIFVGIISMLINKSPIATSIIGLRAILRYVAMYYVVIMVPLNQAVLRKILIAVLVVGVAQIFFGMLQILLGQGFRDFFLPRATSVEVGGQVKDFIMATKGREEGAIFGTVGDTVLYGEFMLIVFCAYLAIAYLPNALFLRDRPLIKAVLAILLVFSVVYSYSRASFIGVGLAVMVFVYYFKGKRVKLKLAIAYSLVLVLFIVAAQSAKFVTSSEEKTSDTGLINNLAMIGTPEYLTMLQTQRLGAWVLLAPTILINKPLLGYGPAFEEALDAINSERRTLLPFPWLKQTFKDVYWVALLGFYGIIGVGCFLMIVVKNLKAGLMLAKISSPSSIERKLAAISVMLGFVTLFILCFTQSMEFRTYSYYYWLFSGLAVSSLRRFGV